MITLQLIKRTDPIILANMAIHYSHPLGFVGRNICYVVYDDNICYGTIAGGSATLHLPGRNEFFDITKSDLNCIINNIFYHIQKVDNKYPVRNFTEVVLNLFCNTIAQDWTTRYGNKVLGFESLVELPRTGEIYRRCGWTEVGITKGFTCKRIAGKGSDNWSGKRVWNTSELKPKLVFCKKF
jgi:Domain of unknown function (DUF4338)